MEDLQAEASCPLCLDYIRDSVTLECGHNFCDSCIHERWNNLEDIFPCPVCLYHCPDRNFKKNNQLCHIIDIIKQIPTRRTKWKCQEEKLLCEKHNELLDLFCEEDLELLCSQCRVSTDHQDHVLDPISKAAVSQRKELQRYTKFLKKKIKNAEMNYESQDLNMYEVRRKRENWKEELQHEFEEIKTSLKKNQALISISLLLEVENMEKNLINNKHQISTYISTLKNLLSDIAMKSLQTDIDLLTSIGNLRDRYEQLSAPDAISCEFKKKHSTLPPHYFGLQKMMSTFQVNLTLDPKTAHSSLTVSEDRKSVIVRTSYFDNHAECTAYPAVLSCEGFESGRHFWQVEVRGTGEWSIGLCKESAVRKCQRSPVLNTCFWSFKQFMSFSETQNTEQEDKAVRFGIFLDFEQGETSVYNLNNRAYLYKFNDIFTEKVMPYFAIGPALKPFSISLARGE